jgi:hypothetical protein
VTAQALTDALNAMTERLDAVRLDSEERDEALAKANEALAASGRRTRRMVIATIGSLVLDIVLTVVLAIVAVQAHSASSTASETRAASVVSCQASNSTRAQEVGLWTHLVQVSEAGPHPGQTPAQLKKSEQELAAFLAYVGRVFTPRNCQQIYKADGG